MLVRSIEVDHHLGDQGFHQRFFMSAAPVSQTDKNICGSCRRAIEVWDFIISLNPFLSALSISESSLCMRAISEGVESAEPPQNPAAPSVQRPGLELIELRIRAGAMTWS